MDNPLVLPMAAMCFLGGCGVGFMWALHFRLQRDYWRARWEYLCKVAAADFPRIDPKEWSPFPADHKST